MAVDSQGVLHRDPDLVDDLPDLPRQRPAVGVAHHQGLGPTPDRGLQGLEGVRGVRPVPVEEVLGVIDHPPALGLQVGHGVLDDAQVLLERGPQDLGDVERPGLPHHRAHRRPGVEERLDVGIVLGTAALAVSGAERGDQRGPPLDVPGPLEELGVLGVGARPASFDEGHTQLVQTPGHTDLVVTGQRDAFSLGPVAESGVVDLNHYQSPEAQHSIRSRGPAGEISAANTVASAANRSRGVTVRPQRVPERGGRHHDA